RASVGSGRGFAIIASRPVKAEGTRATRAAAHPDQRHGHNAGFFHFHHDLLEPISKSPEEDNEAGELNEAKEVLWMIFPSDEDPTLPLDPGEEAFDQPAPQEASQAAPVLRRRLRSVRAVRRDHLDAILT